MSHLKSLVPLGAIALLVLVFSLASASAQDVDDGGDFGELPPPVEVAPEGGPALTPGNCPNQTVCVYSNQDFNGDQANYVLPPGSGTNGTAFGYTVIPVRSAKSNFNNRKVVLAVGASNSSKYCIPPGQNRRGPFSPARNRLRIGPAGSTC